MFKALLLNLVLVEYLVAKVFGFRDAEALGI